MLTYFSAGFSLSSHVCTYVSVCFPRDRLLGRPRSGAELSCVTGHHVRGWDFPPPPLCPLQEVRGPGLTLLSPGGCGRPWGGRGAKTRTRGGGPHPAAECESASQCPSCPTESDPLILSLNTHDSAVNKAVPSTGQTKTRRPRGAAGLPGHTPPICPSFLPTRGLLNHRHPTCSMLPGCLLYDPAWRS